MVAEDLRVAERGALLEVAGDLADRRVDVDHHLVVGSGTRRPSAFEGVAVDSFELADVPERERPQERPQRRRGHHTVAEHRRCRAGAQHVGVIDVRPARKDRMDQRQHLPAWLGATDPADQTNRVIDQRPQVEPVSECRRHDQPGVGDQTVVVEDDLDTVQRLRYSRH